MCVFLLFLVMVSTEMEIIRNRTELNFCSSSVDSTEERQIYCCRSCLERNSNFTLHMKYLDIYMCTHETLSPHAHEMKHKHFILVHFVSIVCNCVCEYVNIYGQSVHDLSNK